jgi:hypothetical protein
MQLMDNSDNSDMHYCDCDCATQSCTSIEAGLCETAGSERGVVLTRQARVVAVCAEENSLNSCQSLSKRLMVSAIFVCRSTLYASERPVFRYCYLTGPIPSKQ